MEAVLGGVESVLKLFDTPHKDAMQYNFNPMDYHPIYGIPAKVASSLPRSGGPGVQVRTWFGSPIPGVEHLNGRLDTHFVGQPEYQHAWRQRKRHSYYNEDLKTQISGYRNRPFQETRLRMGDGTVKSSRDLVNYNTDSTVSVFEPKKDKFYMAAKGCGLLSECNKCT